MIRQRRNGPVRAYIPVRVGLDGEETFVVNIPKEPGMEAGDAARAARDLVLRWGRRVEYAHRHGLLEEVRREFPHLPAAEVVSLAATRVRLTDLALARLYPIPDATLQQLHEEDAREDRLHIPTNPVMQAALKGIYSGGKRKEHHWWAPDDYGRPYCNYKTDDGTITLFFEGAPRAEETVATLWRATVEQLSVETADVLLILMDQISRLANPRTDFARMRVDQIDGYRGVSVRRGSARNLHQDFAESVKALASLRLRMVWKDYQGKGQVVTFGDNLPDHLLDITDITFRDDRRTWLAFQFRCGQALAHFLDRNGLRWVGYYSRSLLQLNPVQDAFAKKMGAYAILIGTIQSKKGRELRVAPATLLDFAGEQPDYRNPRRTVDRLVEGQKRLEECDLLVPNGTTWDRLPGTSFEEWLVAPQTVALNDDLWRLNMAPERARLPSPRRKRARPTPSLPAGQLVLPLGEMPPPSTAQQLVDDPGLLRKFRLYYNIHQDELARALGIARKTLSMYENERRRLPLDVAGQMLEVWTRKHRSTVA